MEAELTITSRILYSLLTLFIVFVYGMIQSGIIRKIVARVAGRYGIPVYQPFIDLIKNYAKRSQITHGMMFYLGPIFRLSGGIGLFMFMPMIFGSIYFRNFSFTGDIVLLMYFQFFGMLGMAMGAGEAGQPNSGIGVSRGLAQFTTAEVPFTLAIIAIAIQYQTLSVYDIVAAQQGGIMNWTVFQNPIATLAGMLAFLGIMRHAPFNVVMAPQEIPIGPPTEYHSTYLGMLQSNRAILHIVESALFMNLFFGGAANWIEFIVKTFIIYFSTVFIGVVFPRYRVDQSVSWFVKVPLVIGILGVLYAKYM
ncbi:MAG: NADH-quinone oxidoreductase subunit H [Candidatus Delongbacteria bacterium]|jgi:NADH-quinone oxidoreductase subunit H|nr:NADH-quinone oxidoreductase subunit H [Candidatus Delongbacteria bacterium]